MTDGDTDDRAHVPTGQLATLPHCQTATLPTSTQPHFHTATLPYFHTSTLPHCHTATLPHCHTTHWTAACQHQPQASPSPLTVLVLVQMQCKFGKISPKICTTLCKGSVLHCNFSQSVWSIRARVVCSCHKKLHAVRRNYAKGSVCIVFPT